MSAQTPKRVLRADRVQPGDVVHYAPAEGEAFDFKVDGMWNTAAPNVRLTYSIDGKAGFVDLPFNHRLLVTRTGTHHS